MSEAEAERQKQWLHTKGTDRLLKAVARTDDPQPARTAKARRAGR